MKDLYKTLIKYAKEDPAKAAGKLGEIFRVLAYQGYVWDGSSFIDLNAYEISELREEIADRQSKRQYKPRKKYSAQIKRKEQRKIKRKVIKSKLELEVDKNPEPARKPRRKEHYQAPIIEPRPNGSYKSILDRVEPKVTEQPKSESTGRDRNLSPEELEPRTQDNNYRQVPTLTPYALPKSVVKTNVPKPAKPKAINLLKPNPITETNHNHTQ